MRVHLDVLGWLYALGGVLGVCTGISLVVLAGGTFFAHGAIGGTSATAASVVWTLGLSALVFLAGGAVMVGVGRAVLARRSGGRPAALWTGAVTLFLLPFGTALGIYTFWTLLNDDARLAFGRRPRAPQSPDDRA